MAKNTEEKLRFEIEHERHLSDIYRDLGEIHALRYNQLVFEYEKLQEEQKEPK
jgi:hypothetical protein